MGVVDCTPSTDGDNFAMLDENPAITVSSGRFAGYSLRFTLAGTPQAIGSATYVTRFHVFAQSPDTLSAWTPAELETVQFGLEIST